MHKQHGRPQPSPPGALPEAEALRRAKQGDAEGFEQLYRMHGRRVYALCLRMTASEADAEDLAQEAFLQAFRKVHTFRGDSAFSTWLHRLTVNVVLMRLRRKRIAEVPLDQPGEEENSLGLLETIGAQDGRVSGTVDRVSLERALARLPAGYRRAFVLHDVEGYEHNEIARLLGCSIGNSKSQLHKARMRLRRLLLRPAFRCRRPRVAAAATPSGQAPEAPDLPDVPAKRGATLEPAPVGYS
jgi:RNA polymerase sigma-70 factor, ECF subfamily